MTQEDSKYLTIQCGKLRVDRPFFQYSKQRQAVLLLNSFVKIKLKMLYTYVLRRLGFQMHFTNINRTQMHTQQTQETTDWSRCAFSEKWHYHWLVPVGPWATFVHKCRWCNISWVAKTAAVIIPHNTVQKTLKRYVLRISVRQ